MPFQACPGIAQCELFFAQDGQHLENVFHLMKEGAWSASDLEDAYNAFQYWIDNNWNDIAVTDASFVGFKGTDLTSETGATFEPTISEPVPGNRVENPLATGLTACVSWKTASRGRSYRGRSFHVGTAIVDVQDSDLTVTAIGLFTAGYTALRGALESASLNQCVLSRVNGGVLREEGIGTPITSFSVGSHLATQRRRLPGRGA